MKNALITGATSGIGAAFSRELAHRGYDLYITGRRRDVIEKEAEEIRKKYGVEVTVFIVDFTVSEDVENFVKSIGEIEFEFLVNNVGFGNKKRFLEDSYENQRKMIEAHIESFCMITHMIAGKMRDKRRGRIINVSSLAAFVPADFNHLYSSTKAFIITFSEALNVELSKIGINVQALCPGFTKTDFHRGLNIDEATYKNRGLLRWMESGTVAELSIKAVEKGGGIFVPGWSNKILYTFIKLLPRKFYYVIARHLKI